MNEDSLSGGRDSARRSRRTVIGGGLGAGAAGLLWRSGRAAAAPGQAVIQGADNNAGATRTILRSSNSSQTAVFVNTSVSGTGVRGDATGTNGIGGLFVSQRSTGMAGFTNANSRSAVVGTQNGAYFDGGAGVFGDGRRNHGVVGATQHDDAVGVLGFHGSTDVLAPGVVGEGPLGVMGLSLGVDEGAGVAGVATGAGGAAGIYGWAEHPSGWAVYADGDAGVNGDLYLWGSVIAPPAAVVLQDPNDPETRVYETTMSSAEPRSVLDGVAALDGAGAAEVALPAAFVTLATELRHQLTAIGAAMPSLHVVPGEGRFTIAGGAPGGRVSWQVTSVRAEPATSAARDERVRAVAAVPAQRAIAARGSRRAQVSGA